MEGFCHPYLIGLIVSSLLLRRIFQVTGTQQNIPRTELKWKKASKIFNSMQAFRPQVSEYVTVKIVHNKVDIVHNNRSILVNDSL